LLASHSDVAQITARGIDGKMSAQIGRNPEKKWRCNKYQKWICHDSFFGNQTKIIEEIAVKNDEDCCCYGGEGY